jgi:hypothetical protein
LTLRAQDFVACDAVFAVTTGRKKPRNTYPRTSQRLIDSGAYTLNNPRNLVTRNDGKLYERKLAVPDHQITVTNTACVHSNEYFTRPRRRDGAIVDLKLALGLTHNGRSHSSKSSFAAR